MLWRLKFRNRKFSKIYRKSLKAVREMAAMAKKEESESKSNGDERFTKTVKEWIQIDEQSLEAVQNSVPLKSPEPYIPNEIVLRIIKESITKTSGSLRISMSVLLCCRAWLNLALSIIWKQILIKPPRIVLLLYSLTFQHTSTMANLSYLRSLTVTADQSTLRKLRNHLLAFNHLQHLGLTQMNTHDHRSRYYIAVDDLVLALPSSLRSLELVLPTLGFPKRCDHFCQTLKTAIKQLHSLRIFLKEWIMVESLARFKSIWTQTFRSLEHFTFVLPLGTSNLSSCDPVRQMQTLREIAVCISKAKSNGTLPSLNLCRISAYRGKIERLNRWRGGTNLDVRSTTFDAISNKVLSYPLFRLSEMKFDCEGKGIPGLFWTRRYASCEDLQGLSMSAAQETHIKKSASDETDMNQLVNILGTMDDLMNMWEGKWGNTYGQALNLNEHSSNKRYSEIMATLAEEEVKFIRDREEELDPSKLPHIETLM